MERRAVLFGVITVVLAAFALFARVAAEDTQRGTGLITGTVLDAETGDPVAYANVIVVGTSCGAMTLENGVFTISDVPVGTTDLRVMMMGYPSQTLHGVVVEAEEATELIIRLDKFWPESESEQRSLVGTDVDVTDNELQCEITPLTDRFNVGDCPSFKVTIYNVSPKTFYLVGAIDGSERQARYPHVTLTIEGPDGGIKKPRLLGCGHINRLKLRDFVHVRPWGVFEPISSPFWEPTDFIYSRFAKPGRYSVTFRYSSEAIDYANWAGRSTSDRVSQDVVETLKKVPRVTIGCSITVDVYE